MKSGGRTRRYRKTPWEPLLSAEVPTPRVRSSTPALFQPRLEVDDKGCAPPAERLCRGTTRPAGGCSGLVFDGRLSGGCTGPLQQRPRLLCCAGEGLVSRHRGKEERQRGAAQSGGTALGRCSGRQYGSKPADGWADSALVSFSRPWRA